MKTILLFFILCSGVFILFLPVIPGLVFHYYEPEYKHKYLSAVKKYAASTTNPLHLPNTLLLPQIGVQSPIIEGNTEQSLNKGSWHIPQTGTPVSGNMVISGHRFLYLPPNNTTFYNLDQVHTGEDIFVMWNSTLYTYKIRTVETVSPLDTSIENTTSLPTLTLFTCTPLWTAQERLVIIADQIQNRNSRSAHSPA